MKNSYKINIKMICFIKYLKLNIYFKMKETSAKENINITECFQKLGQQIIEKAMINE